MNIPKLTLKEWNQRILAAAKGQIALNNATAKLAKVGSISTIDALKSACRNNTVK